MALDQRFPQNQVARIIREGRGQAIEPIVKNRCIYQLQQVENSLRRPSSFYSPFKQELSMKGATGLKDRRVRHQGGADC
jgi:hypothetical protein